MTQTEYTFKSLSEQFELLAAGLESKNASAEQRRSILRRMRALIAAADGLVLKEELHLDSEQGLQQIDSPSERS